MPAFNFISKNIIIKFLADGWEKYSGNYNSLENDNQILQKKIGTILQLSRSDVQNILQAVRLKALGQILGLAGHAVEAQKLPTKIVDIKDIKTGKTENAVTIPDFNDERIVNFANWHQLEYLLYNLCFLVECYIQIQKGLIQEKALPITKSTLLIALEHEIWITLNAYNLRKVYEEILEEFRKDNDKEKCIKSFSEVNSSFIKVIKDSHETEFEFCLACGSEDHAIYLNVIFDKSNQELILKIDNSSEEEPTVYEPLDINKEEQVDDLKRYLNDIGFALKDKNNTARGIIYNEYDEYSFKKAKQNAGYQPFPKQQAPNCVVEGYWRGMWDRVEDIEERSANKVFKWYLNYLKQYVAITHPIPDAKTKHRKLTGKLFAYHPKITIDQLKNNDEIAFQTICKAFKDKYTSPEATNIQRLLLRNTRPIIDSFINLTLTDERNRNEADVLRTKKIIPLNDLFATNMLSHTLIVGPPGIGKTTLCRYIAYQWALLPNDAGKRLFNLNQIDVLIWLPLRNLINCTEHMVLPEFIHKTCLDEPAKKLITVEMIQKFILNNDKIKLYYLIDGYDEIVTIVTDETNPKYYLKKIINELIKHENWLLTSRPSEIDIGLLGSCHYMENIGFINSNINEYINNFFNSIETLTASHRKNKVETLQKLLSRNPHIKDSARTPINLELICSFWESKHDTDDTEKTDSLTMTKLYYKVIANLLRKFLIRCLELELHNLKMTKKDINNMAEDDIMNYEICKLILKFLGNIAWYATQNNTVIIGSNIIRDFYQRYKNSLTLQQVEMIIKDLHLLDPIGELKISILDNNHYFVHRSFQDFLASYALVSSPELFLENLEQKSTEKWYEVSFAFAAGLLSYYKDAKNLKNCFNIFNKKLFELVHLNKHPTDPKQKFLDEFQRFLLLLRIFEETQESHSIFKSNEKDLPLWNILLDGCVCYIYYILLSTDYYEPSNDQDKQFTFDRNKQLIRYLNDNLAFKKEIDLSNKLRIIIGCDNEVNKRNEKILEALGDIDLVLNRIKNCKNEEELIFLYETLKLVARKEDADKIAKGLIDFFKIPNAINFYYTNSLCYKESVSIFSFLIEFETSILVMIKEQITDIGFHTIALIKILESYNITVMPLIKNKAHAKNLFHDQISIRISALKELTKNQKIDDESILCDLVNALNDNNLWIRQTTASFLIKINKHIKLAKNALLKNISCDYRWVKLSSLKILSTVNILDENELSNLLNCPNYCDNEFRKSLVALLKTSNKLSDKIILDAFIKNLNNLNVDIILSTMDLIIELNYDDNIITENIIQKITHNNILVRRKAIEIINKTFKADESSVIQAHIQNLNSNNVGIIWDSIEYLRKNHNLKRIVNVYQIVVNILTKIIDTQDPSIVCGILEIFSKIAKKDESIIDALVKKLSDLNSIVRKHAWNIIEEFNITKHEKVIKEIFVNIEHENISVRHDAVKKLNILRSEYDYNIIKKLIKFLNDKEVTAKVKHIVAFELKERDIISLESVIYSINQYKYPHQKITKENSNENHGYILDLLNDNNLSFRYLNALVILLNDKNYVLSLLKLKLDEKISSLASISHSGHSFFSRIEAINSLNLSELERIVIGYGVLGIVSTEIDLASIIRVIINLLKCLNLLNHNVNISQLRHIGGETLKILLDLSNIYFLKSYDMCQEILNVICDVIKSFPGLIIIATIMLNEMLDIEDQNIRALFLKALRQINLDTFEKLQIIQIPNLAINKYLSNPLLLANGSYITAYSIVSSSKSFCDLSLLFNNTSVTSKSDKEYLIDNDPVKFIKKNLDKKRIKSLILRDLVNNISHSKDASGIMEYLDSHNIKTTLNGSVLALAELLAKKLYCFERLENGDLIIIQGCNQDPTIDYKEDVFIMHDKFNDTYHRLNLSIEYPFKAQTNNYIPAFFKSSSTNEFDKRNSLLNAPLMIGLAYEEVSDDADTLYKAISLSLEKDKNELRQMVVKYLKDCSEEFLLLTFGITVDEYLTSISEGCKQVDIIEIEALMKVLDRPIIIIGTMGFIENPQALEKFSKQEPIYLYNNGYNHYDYFIKIKGFSAVVINSCLKKRREIFKNNFSTNVNISHNSLDLVDINKNLSLKP